MKPLNEYITIQQNSEGNFYAVHMGGNLFYAGVDDNNNPIWSDNLQDSEIHCRESAEMLVEQYAPHAKFDPIGVDLHVVA